VLADQFRLVEHLEHGARVVKPGLDLRLAEAGPEIAAFHPVDHVMGRALAPEMMVIGRERRPQRPARITSRRLDPDAFEAAVPKNLAIRDAV